MQRIRPLRFAGTRRVVLVYSRVGGGHLSAAQALAEELEAGGEASTKLVDVYVERGRFPVTLFPGVYARLARNYPRMWSLVYHASTGLDSKRVLGPFLRRGVRQLMAEEQPDLVVSVLPGVNGLLAEAARKAGARFEVVLTDWHSVHSWWVAPGVAHYTTPTDSARDDCIRFGAPASAVEVSGIPVRRAFATPPDRSPARQRCLTELGLDPRRFTVLAMVGAEGSPRALGNLARLAQVNRDLQLVVVCGRNAELRRRVERLRTRMPLLAVGFVVNVAELMRAADVLVTKAGGMTLAEAFACAVPTVVHDVLAGQEAGNLEYVVQQAAVEYAPSPDELARLIAELYDDPLRRTTLARRGARLARPGAARRIAGELLERLWR
ncbi:MAG: glycosyltransferase [Chloroflexota bacterium]|nr:glycosyltransferase [Chloroflexota bacterium]